MYRLLMLQIEKKLSFLSILILYIFIGLAYGVAIYEASFELSHFELIDNFDSLRYAYWQEMSLILYVLGILFSLLLSLQELFGHTANFDAFFVSAYGKKKIGFVKILSYYVIIFFFTAYLFVGVVFIFWLRFSTMEDIVFIGKAFLIYVLYFLGIFTFSFLLITFFQNYFTVLFVALFILLGSVLKNTKMDTVFSYILPRIESDIQRQKCGFSTPLSYAIIWLVMLFVLQQYVYQKKDILC